MCTLLRIADPLPVVVLAGVDTDAVSASSSGYWCPRPEVGPEPPGVTL